MFIPFGLIHKYFRGRGDQEKKRRQEMSLFSSMDDGNWWYEVTGSIPGPLTTVEVEQVVQCEPDMADYIFLEDGSMTLAQWREWMDSLGVQ